MGNVCSVWSWSFFKLVEFPNDGPVFEWFIKVYQFWVAWKKFRWRRWRLFDACVAFQARFLYNQVNKVRLREVDWSILFSFNIYSQKVWISLSELWCPTLPSWCPWSPVRFLQDSVPQNESFAYRTYMMFPRLSTHSFTFNCLKSTLFINFLRRYWYETWPACFLTVDILV